MITRRGSERIAEAACDLAAKRQRLTIIHKSNVLKSDWLFLQTCREVAERQGVPYEDMLVDAAAYNLVVNPKRFDVMVTTNLFGDILSDEAAGLSAAWGFVPAPTSASPMLYLSPFTAALRISPERASPTPSAPYAAQP